MAVKSMVLIILVAAIVTTVTMNNVYAVVSVDKCNGHDIERINDKEVKVNGTKYTNGDKITLDNKTYTVKIGSGSIKGTDKNDFIVGSNNVDKIYGYQGDDFIVGLGQNDHLYGDYIGTINIIKINNIKGGDDIICGNDGRDWLYGDYILGNKGSDKLEGGDDKLEGGDDNDRLYGDYILGDKGSDIITGGSDKLEGGDDNDRLYGDYILGDDHIFGDTNMDIITGGSDKLEGGKGDDHLYGDYILGDKGSDKLKGGDDKQIEGGKGDDHLYGDWIEGKGGDDKQIEGGNDIINAKDDVKDSMIDGDLLQAKTATNSEYDICSTDDNDMKKVNCEYENLKGLVKINGKGLDGIEQDMLKKKIQINQNQKMPITFKLNNSIGPVKITSIVLTTPMNNKCIFKNNLPITVPIGGELKFTYPDDFMNKNNCNVAGMYMLEIVTEVGDPIVTEFAVSFQVLNESIIGTVGLVGVSIAIFMLYRRQKTY